MRRGTRANDHNRINHLLGWFTQLPCGLEKSLKMLCTRKAATSAHGEGSAAVGDCSETQASGAYGVLVGSVEPSVARATFRYVSSRITLHSLKQIHE